MKISTVLILVTVFIATTQKTVIRLNKNRRKILGMIKTMARLIQAILGIICISSNSIMGKDTSSIFILNTGYYTNEKKEMCCPSGFACQNKHPQ